MIKKQTNLKIMQRCILKSILPSIHANREWLKWVSSLAKLTHISYNDQAKQKKLKCPSCKRLYDNALLLLLHLEISHQLDLDISAYEIDHETLTVFMEIRRKGNQEVSYAERYIVGLNERNLQSSLQRKSDNRVIQLNNRVMQFELKTRAGQILDSILAKCKRKKEKTKRQYFHPIDIFRQIGEESEEEGEGVSEIERELQKIKIADFSDVNENDKAFFVFWNEEVHRARKEHVYMNGEVVREALLGLAGRAKGLKVRRINLVVHGYTLWSSGKASAEDVSAFLKAYDQS